MMMENYDWGYQSVCVLCVSSWVTRKMGEERLLNRICNCNSLSLSLLKAVFAVECIKLQLNSNY